MPLLPSSNWFSSCIGYTISLAIVCEQQFSDTLYLPKEHPLGSLTLTKLAVIRYPLSQVSTFLCFHHCVCVCVRRGWRVKKNHAVTLPREGESAQQIPQGIGCTSDGLVTSPLSLSLLLHPSLPPPPLFSPSSSILLSLLLLSSLPSPPFSLSLLLLPSLPPPPLFYWLLI